jgi:DUF4097 and DUF4098 domain-containing protein YvlB
MSAPTPVPPPYYQRPRSIFGPLVLITLGVLFLLGTTGVIEWDKLHGGLARYWPLLLILWGVAKLIEHFWARHRGEPTPRLGAGGIVFLVFFIMIAGGFTATKDWDFTKLWDWNCETDFDPFDSHYDFTETSTPSLTGVTETRVLCDRCNVTVTPSQDNQVHVLARKTIRTRSQDAANQLNESNHVKFTQQGSVWVADLTGNGSGRIRFNLDLQLPRALSVSLTAHRGNLSISQRDAPVDLGTDCGSIAIDQVKGNAVARLGNGSITAKNVTGNVQVEGSVNDGTIAAVSGALDFNAGFDGNIQISNIGGHLRFKSKRTELELAKLDGEMNFGQGELRAKSAAGPVRLTTRSNEIRFENVSGGIEVENRNRIVHLRPAAPLGNIDITNSDAGIELELPSDASFTLDAESKDGNIDVTDFPPLTVDNTRRDASVRGTVGHGGPEIRLRTRHGTIEIRKQ